MKKFILIVVSFLFIGSVNANSINSIKMDIYIDSDGNAKVVENWNYTSNKNTEVYHAYESLGQSTITDFKVSDSTGTNYTLESSWDIDGSFNDKKYKYGYHKTSSGVELCLGISHYGTYTYNLTYTINNFIYELDDAQLLYWTLLPSTSENLKSYYIRIHADNPFSDDLPVWGFGVYGDYAYVSDGVIELSSADSVDSDEYVTVLAKFPKGTFNTSKSLNHDFSYYLDMAQEGSKTYKTSIWSIIFSVLSTLFWFIVPLFLFFLALKYGKSFGNRVAKKKKDKNAPYFRDLPCGEDIKKAYLIGAEYGVVNKETNLFGAFLLKWLKEDKVRVIKEEGSGLFKKDNVKIHLLETPTDEEEARLYNYLMIASRDGILEQREFSLWCENNYNKIYTLLTDICDTQLDTLVKSGMITEQDKFFSLNKYIATPALDEIGARMIGLKKFFKEFGSLNEKEPIEVKLWNEYLIYAQLFGVASEVAKQFKKLYPDILVDNTYDDIVMINTFSYRSVGNLSSARSKAQSYSSGGGGFSSGGGGGGSFGGGGSMGSR